MKSTQDQPKTMNRVVLSSQRHDWATPRAFFAALDREFHFTLDACATKDNACLPVYLSPEQDALSVSWRDYRVYMNPPFGYGIGKWVQKAWYESRNGAFVVCLLPARTDTSWWHSNVVMASEIRFIRGRMRFSGHTVNAPFPCAVVVFDGGPLGNTRYTTMDRILDEEAA